MEDARDFPASMREVPGADDGLAAELERVKQRLAENERGTEETKSLLRQKARNVDEDRSLIARVVIWGFVDVVLAVLLLLAVQGAATGEWKEPASRG